MRDTFLFIQNNRGIFNKVFSTQQLDAIRRLAQENHIMFKENPEIDYLCHLKFFSMKISEDQENIYIEDYIIPKGSKKEDLKAREKIINAIYRKWTAENPEKCLFNEDLKD